MLSLKQLSLATAIAATTFAASAAAATAPVNGVTWTKSAEGNLNNLQLTDRTAAVVFIRPTANSCGR